ncbi:DUF3306 domain-containing protein [uncultured Roseibium sp.]|uniref:DUF3306 domain-containing protein n=1 Tax=uncultured Roseibium sp. TaxID=1936171 RepID=UPI0026140E99|nr:DUF3306 domain-containing protein [uncultured Roseibium sp.]
MSGSEGEGKDFWSRRKAAVRKAEEAEQAEQEAIVAAEERAGLEQKTDQEILEELDLPDPDTLTKDDDFSGFLSATVPERIRRRALRRLWGMNPVLANIDGLVDYGEDYTDAATVIDNLQTVYKIGKGMLEQFADEDAEDVENAELSDDIVRESVASETKNENSEENTALHNDYVESETAPVQLTQADELVQSAEKHENPSESQEAYSEKVDLTLQVTRRRLRFDYS